MLYYCVIYGPDSDFDFSTLNILLVWISPVWVSSHLQNVRLKMIQIKALGPSKNENLKQYLPKTLNTK